MPFPTDCYESSTENYNCGNPLPMTPWISAEMTKRYRFLVGLGEDMIGYMSPPGIFVGDGGELASEPWFAMRPRAPTAGATASATATPTTPRASAPTPACW
jgi:hypothetical protein